MCRSENEAGRDGFVATDQIHVRVHLVWVSLNVCLVATDALEQNEFKGFVQCGGCDFIPDLARSQVRPHGH